MSGHPFLSIIAAMAAGILSGFVTAILQTNLAWTAACRYHCEYSVIFCEHCGYGRSISDQYEPDNNSIYYDERCTFRYPTEGKRGYYNCSDRSDPRDHISGIFPENKTWSCNQGNWK